MSESVINQIAAVEQRLKLCQNRIEDIDKKLQREELGVEERRMLNEEHHKLEDTQLAQEGRLASLRAENRKTMMIAIGLIVVAYLIFSLYWGTSSSISQ